ncbi:Ribonucleases P/MRP protein subunit POP1 [Candida viswanathii]|uniref:Ribonucleases P/MRP protein subunit POP1 n=1 Tax=Candida viswanathii TaxID=5486 RepID=A0A367XZF6_9ASCO|nr:Ribonucleases P/MRP protein subunit POP1 [Candida viswanathii]
MSGNHNNKKQFNRKKTRLYNSRNIKSQNFEPSYDSEQKVLDVNQFVQSRDYEIKSFEQSQLNSKNASATRVFQALPRSLRRRAASHNVKRIPKRLRARAKREMSTSVPVKKMPRGRKLYKLMLRNRLLKVASKMKAMRYDPMDVTSSAKTIRTQFKELRDELKKIQEEDDEEGRTRLNNEVGSRDITGANELAPRPRGNIKYAKRQKEFVWIPTHIWHVKRFHMVKKYGFQIPYSPNQKCFKLMNRWNRAKSVCFDTSYFLTMVLTLPDYTGEPEEDPLVDLVKLLTLKKKVSQKVLSGEKSYSGVLWGHSGPGLVYVNKELRTILIRVYPSAYKGLFHLLQSRLKDVVGANIYDCRYSLGSIEMSGPLSLRSLSKIFHFKDMSLELRDIWASLSESTDSELIPVGTTFTFNLQDPRIWQRPTKFPFKSPEGHSIYDTVIALNSNSHINNEVVAKLCSVSGREVSYNKQLLIKQLGKFFANPLKQPEEVAHSQIPVILSKIDTQKWVLIIPWHWVLPFWIQLTKVTDVKPGGSKQMIQFQFENQKQSFPEDYPWLKDGWALNTLVGEANQLKADKLPKSQVSVAQAERNVSELFSGNNCAWRTLKNLIFVAKFAKLNGHNRSDIEASFANFIGPEREINSVHDLIQVVKTLEKEIPDNDDSVPVVELYDKKMTHHKDIYKDEYTVGKLSYVVDLTLPVVPISVRIANDGTIEDNARIYSNADGGEFSCVGFVTTGSMNLNLGKCSGIGSIIAQAWLLENGSNKLYIRNPGKSKTYLVEYSLI